MSRYPNQYPPQPPQGGQYGAYARQQGGPPPLGFQQAGMRDYAGDTSVGSFFNFVYAWMAVGLGVTAVTGYAVSVTPVLRALFVGNLAVTVVVFLALFGLAYYVQSQLGRITATTATGLFMLYAVLTGALLSYIFIYYPAPTLAGAFMLTAGTFAAVSVYGFVTKRDLSGIGSIAVMLVFGVIIAALVNVFILHSSALGWVITYAILVLFIVITAYQTQTLKEMAEQFRGNPVMAKRAAIVGSLILYISFINLFQSILQILGSRR